MTNIEYFRTNIGEKVYSTVRYGKNLCLGQPSRALSYSVEVFLQDLTKIIRLADPRSKPYPGAAGSPDCPAMSEDVYPGPLAISGGPNTAQLTLGGVSSTAQLTPGGVSSTAQPTMGGVSGTAQLTLGGVPSTAHFTLLPRGVTLTTVPPNR
jgi:hypothetical protein